MILLQIQHENNFYLPVNTDKPKFVAFMVIACTTVSFMTQISSSENVSKRDGIMAPVAKYVNSQGYSKLREPIKMHENCYSLIW